MRKIFSFLLMALFSVGMWAATETTVYYAVPASVVGTYTVKLNTNQQTNPDSWQTYTMTKTDLTYEDNLIYSASFTDLWDGLDKMQIQLYDGEDWKSQEQPISTWTHVSAYNGKMWVHGGSKWVELSGEEPDPTVAIKGAWDKWATTPAMELATDKKTASIVLAMTEGVYEFGLELNSSWTANGAVFTRDDNSKEVTGAGSNMKLTVDADGDYTFTWTFETNTLAVTYPDVVVIPAKYYLTGDSALVVDAGFDKAKAWSPSAIKVTEDTYVLSGLKAGQAYQLKATIDGDWGTAKGYSDMSAVAPCFTTNGDNNIIFKMAKDGDVTVTLKGEVFTVEGDFAMPTVALAGTMTGWSQSVMEIAEDKLSASIKVNLEVGVDSFKIVRDGTWLSLNGADYTNYRIKRDWPKAAYVNIENEGLNFVIDVDKAGEYIFKWTYSKDSLYVTFPNLESFAVSVNELTHGAIHVQNGEAAIEASVEEGSVLSVWASVNEEDKYDYTISNLRAYKTDDAETFVAISEEGKLVMPGYPITITADEAATAYVIAGDGSMMGEDWKPVSTANQMVKNGSKYELEKTNVELEAGTYEYKLTVNGEYEAIEGNRSIALEKSGEYTLTWTYVPSTNTLTLVPDLIQEKEVKTKVYIAGSFTKWGDEKVELEMAANELTAAQTIHLSEGVHQFQVVENGWFGIEFYIANRKNSATPIDLSENPGSHNMYLWADVEGDYTFTWTYATKSLSITYPAAPTPAAAWIGGNFAEEWGYMIMEKALDGKSASYKMNIENPGIYEFLMIVDNEYHSNGYSINREFQACAGITGNTGNMSLTVDWPGEYTFTWVYENDSLNVAFAPVPPITYYLTGTFVDYWETRYEMSENMGVYSVSTNLTDGEDPYEFQIISVQGDVTTWYGQQNPGFSMDKENCTNWELMVEGYDIGLKASKSGLYTFKFTPETKLISVEFPNDEPSALDNIDVTKMAKKVIIDGQLYILHQGTMYNVQGQTVK